MARPSRPTSSLLLFGGRWMSWFLILLTIGRGTTSLAPVLSEYAVDVGVEEQQQQHLTSRLRSVVVGGRRRELQGGSDVEIPYRIRLVLAIEYLNDESAIQIESSRTVPSTSAAKHFCMSVNQQAGGNQVRSNAKEIEATIESRITKRSDNSNDYQCLIRATNRIYTTYTTDDADDGSYDDDIVFQQGFFALEIVVEQLVHVTSQRGELSFAEVAAIVKTGFNRGQGGRVQFISLLQDHPVFADIEDVEVLDDVSPPQEPPTLSPSLVPSDFPSMEPSLTPTEDPSLSPTIAPSRVPSVSPTESPTMDPSEMPSMSPTVVRKSANRQPLIVLAILGGLATILVSLFFIFCVWYPICVGWKGNRQEEAHRPSNSEPQHRIGEQQNSVMGSTSASIQTSIPSLLTLEEDTLSLANTSLTLGDKTARNSVTMNRVGKATTGTSEEAAKSGSFDEGSVYTSTGSSTMVEVGTNVIPTPEASGTAAASESEHEFLQASNKRVDPPALFSTQRQDSIRAERGVEMGIGVDTSMVDTKGFDPFEGQNDEESSFGFNSKGFDEDDDGSGDTSSYGFGSVALSDPSFGPQNTKSTGGRMSPSSTSTRTKRIENTVVSATPALRTVEPSVQNVASWHWSSEHPESDRGDVLSLVSHSASTDRSSNVASSNDVLLRTLLEGAGRDLTKRKSSSTQSWASWQSAPSRLLDQWAKERFKSTQTNIRPINLTSLVSSEDPESSVKQSMSSSRSVGGHPRSREPIQIKRFASDTSMAAENNDEPQEFHTPTKEKNLNDDEMQWRTPPTFKRKNHSLTNTAATPKKHTSKGYHSHMEERRADVGTPLSPPGILGIANPTFGTDVGESSAPWLQDREGRAMGARPRVGDVGSARSVISSHSEKSLDSFTSLGDSLPSLRSGMSYPSRMESPLSLTSTLDSTHDEHKSGDSSTPPRNNLEQDLSRLRRSNAAAAARGHIKTSSFSESSFADSRSTLSSRVEPRKTTADEVRVVVYAPPGKIDVVLGNRHDGKGTFVSEVRPSSALRHKLSPGDKLVAIDGVDVTNMAISKITALMSFRAAQERRLTVIPSSPFRSVVAQESKQDITP